MNQHQKTNVEQKEKRQSLAFENKVKRMPLTLNNRHCNPSEDRNSKKEWNN